MGWGGVVVVVWGGWRGRERGRDAVRGREQDLRRSQQRCRSWPASQTQRRSQTWPFYRRTSPFSTPLSRFSAAARSRLSDGALVRASVWSQRLGLGHGVGIRGDDRCSRRATLSWWKGFVHGRRWGSLAMMAGLEHGEGVLVADHALHPPLRRRAWLQGRGGLVPQVARSWSG